MEPLGTITMYYPLLEQHIIDTLETIMLEAEDYTDFVFRLGQKVSTEDVSKILAYIAAVHARNLGNSEINREIISKHGGIASVKALLSNDIETRNLALDEALTSELDNWIKIKLHSVNAISPDFDDHLNSLQSFDKAKELLETDEELRCFKPLILSIQGTIYRNEGDIQAAILALEDGLKIADEIDDRVMAIHLHLRIGNLIKETSAKESWDIFDKAHRSAKSIGLKDGVGVSLLEMGKVSYIRGEYDLALQCMLECDNLYSSALSRESLSVSINLTRVYYAMGNGQEAMTWVNTAINRTKAVDVWNYLLKAQSLLLLGRTKEALNQLDLGKTVAMKEGREWDFAKYYYVNGLYENAIGKPLNGIASLEQSFEIIDRMNLGILKGSCLIALTRAEMSIHDAGADSDMSGPWMSRLEQYAKEKDLPGILMEHALLKAEFQAGQNRIDAARKTLSDALVIYDSPSVVSLHSKIRERISGLDLSMQSDIS